MEPPANGMLFTLIPFALHATLDSQLIAQLSINLERLDTSIDKLKYALFE